MTGHPDSSLGAPEMLPALPGGHKVQALDADKLAKDPPSHFKHSWCPGRGLYVPLIHGEHSKPSGPVWPALHVQLVTFWLPTGEKEKAGQVVQAVVASSELQIWPRENFPEAHCVQVFEPFTTSEKEPPSHISPSKTKPLLDVPILHGPTVTAILVVRVPLIALGILQLSEVLDNHTVESQAVRPMRTCGVKSTSPKSLPTSITRRPPRVGEFPPDCTVGVPTNSVV